MHVALTTSRFTYSTVSDEDLLRLPEFKQFKKLRKLRVRDESAIAAIRLALRRLARGEPFIMGTHGDTVLNEAMARRHMVAKTSEYVGRFKWTAGPDPDSCFYKWVLGGSEPKARGGTMNCWESVLFGAYKAKLLTRERIAEVYGEYDRRMALREEIKKELVRPSWLLERQQDLKKREHETYSAEEEARLQTIVDAGKQRIRDLTMDMTAVNQLLLRGAPTEYNPRNPDSPRPLKGDIVIFGSAAGHVAMATGNLAGSPEVLSLWHSPDNHDFFQLTTVAKLVRVKPNRVFFESWRVDGDGRVFLPVTTPSRLCIVRVAALA